MKRLFLLGLFAYCLLFRVSAQSCCVTGAGSNCSIAPVIEKHLLGLRWSYSRLSNTAVSLNPELNGLKTTEHINTLDIIGRFNLTRRLQLTTLLPITFISQQSALSSQQSRGLGDITLLLQYAVLNPQRYTEKNTRHQLRLGAGAKLPSGEYGKNSANLYNTSVQPGTGSIDFTGSAIYSLRHKKFGFSVRGTYKANTPNAQTFKFGDKAEGEAIFFLVFENKNVSITPALALNYFYTFNNINYGQAVYKSAGQTLSPAAMLTLSTGNFAFELNAQPVLFTQVNVMAFSQVFSTSIGAFYTF